MRLSAADQIQLEIFGADGYLVSGIGVSRNVESDAVRAWEQCGNCEVTVRGDCKTPLRRSVTRNRHDSFIDRLLRDFVENPPGNG